jgi:hypothetical protein
MQLAETSIDHRFAAPGDDTFAKPLLIEPVPDGCRAVVEINIVQAQPADHSAIGHDHISHFGATGIALFGCVDVFSEVINRTHMIDPGKPLPQMLPVGIHQVIQRFCMMMIYQLHNNCIIHLYFNVHVHQVKFQISNPKFQKQISNSKSQVPNKFKNLNHKIAKNNLLQLEFWFFFGSWNLVLGFYFLGSCDLCFGFYFLVLVILDLVLFCKQLVKNH